ncbi:hypothetical protein [Skermanella pratensis]|uniref:hypothetical protein n=1 Tax=Skermanella pratensis TaxID=2233999 RepID=UPI0013010302|nr:hypothetical protein [Skermanella pratensis]
MTGGQDIQAFEHNPRVAEVIREARNRGLLDTRSKPTGGRLYEALLEEAKRVSGITGTTELLTYALAKVAVEDDFGQKLLARKGKVPRGTFSGDGA